MKAAWIFAAILALAPSTWSQPLAIQPPKGWIPSLKAPMGIIAQYAAPALPGAFTANLNLTLQSPKPGAKDTMKTPAQIAAYFEKGQSRLFGRYHPLEKAPRSIGGIAGMILVSHYDYGKTELAAFQFVFPLEGRIGNAIYTCARADLQRLRPDFEASLATLSRTTVPLSPM